MALKTQLCVVFLASALGVLLIGPRAIRMLRALKWLQPMRHEDCPPLIPLQQAKQGTPTMGGLIVLGIAILGAAAFGGFSGFEGWLVLGAVGSLGAMGCVDDWQKLRRPNAKGLRCMPKLLVALLVGAMFGMLSADPGAGFRQLVVPWLGERVEVGWWWIL